MYTIESVPEQIDYPKHIRAAIAKNVKVMTGAPLPLIGLRGVRYLAGKVAKLKGSVPQQRLYLTHIVRMQEEIGTGGAGFRFMYASFLQEAGVLLADERLQAAAQELTLIGDQWRQFALLCVKQSRGKDTGLGMQPIAQALQSIAQQERVLFKDLALWAKQRK